ncbi:hypothetical protein [Glaciihabitans tibetensis]|uniref:hypothetical protein n=1 Tax=Glaciihabitans tibetensis TaxID=1266600 RepID=UPI0011B22E9D|nr:hypothetical protein [Glaciihabitans tibetensis]
MRAVGAAVALALALTAPALLGAAHAQAADGDVTWSVQPATESAADGRSALEYSVDPGSVIADHVAVTNFSAAAVTFHVYAADATTDFETASFTLVGEDTPSTDLGGWTSVGGGPATCADTGDGTTDPACAAALGVTLTVEPGTAAIIPVNISVPANATPGDHSAGIVAAYTTPSADGGAIAVSQRVGTRIYLRVAGDTAPALQVAGAVASYTGGWNPFAGGTASIGFDVQNTGNTRVSAAPVATLTGPFGISLGTATATTVENLLPGARGHVVVDVSDIPPLFLLIADIAVTPQAAAGVAGSDVLPVAAESSATTWAVPWSLLGLLVLLAAVVVGAIWWRRTSRARLAIALDDYAHRVREETLATIPSAATPSTESQVTP